MSGIVNIALLMALTEASEGKTFTPDELADLTKAIYEDAEGAVYPDSPTEEEAEELASFFIEAFDMDTLYEYAIQRMAHWYRKHPESYREDYAEMYEATADYDPPNEEEE